MERAARVVLFLFATLLIVSCGGGSGNTNQGGGTTTTVTSVTPSCTPTAVTAGATSTCSATVQGQDNPSQVVTWSVSPASAGTITTAGVFTSSSNITAVTAATITAASTVPGYTNITGPATVTINPPPPPPPPVPTITATPTTITLGQSTTIAWSVTGTTTSISVSGPGLTTSSSATGSVQVTPTTTGTATYTVTATNAAGTFSATATVTVNATSSIQSVVVTCSPASITTAQTSTCTAKVNGTGGYSVTVTWTATGGTISASPASAVFTPSGVGSATVTATSAQDSTKSGSAAITVTTPPTPVITSITPRVQLCNACEFPEIAIYGSGFVDGQKPVCTPDPNVQQTNVINSGEVKLTLGIDAIHNGSGDRSCKICNSDGVTGCSNAWVFGLYYENDCFAGTSQVFCLNPQETVAGQHLWPNGPNMGQPENGYVDVFSLTGKLEGNFFVGQAANTSFAMDNVTSYIVIGGSVYDKSGNLTFITPAGGSNAPITAVAAYGGYGCFLQPSADTLGCFSLTEGSTSSPTVNDVTVGNNPQSLTMGQVNGKTYAFVLTSASGGATTIESVDVSDGMTELTSKSVTGITAGTPGGSGVITLDSLGIGLIVSYGDNIAVPFNETTLTPASGITLPGLPVNVVADTTNGVALVGNANATTPGGNITVVDPIQGTATVKSSDKSPALPVGLAVIPSDNDFLNCPSDGTACSSFPLP